MRGNGVLLRWRGARPSCDGTSRGARRGFSLVELLVVIGIIGLIIAILLPSLSKAREQAKSVACRSNLRQVGIALEMYANLWRGAIYPPKLGSPHPPETRWPIHVFKPPAWNPPIMRCPSDQDPFEDHTYTLNGHLYQRQIKLNSTNFGGKSISQIIVAGEKKTTEGGYYMEPGDYQQMIELYRHGLSRGSNYLYLDWHVGSLRDSEPIMPSQSDPWDIPVTGTGTGSR